MPLLQATERALMWLAVIATAAMMLLTSADALLRYLVNTPIVGAYELTEKYLMVAAVCLGFGYAYRGGAFIRVTFLVERLPPGLARVANWLSYLASVGCCLLLAYATGLQAWQALGDSTTLATVPILVGPSQLIVPVGFVALLALMLLDLGRVGSGQAMLFAQDTPADSA